MLNSRDLSTLHSTVAAKARSMKQRCADAGIDIIFTSTYRDDESQAAIYAQGRTTPGDIVTNAKPGESWHNWRCAFDIVIVRNGKAVWSTKDPAWKQVGEIGESCGLEWAGRWKGRLQEMAHFQYTAGLKLADFRAGKNLPAA